MKRLICLLVLVIVASSIVSAETIQFKSGKEIEGKIVEKTDKHIKLDIGVGMPITYFLDEIESIQTEEDASSSSSFSSQEGKVYKNEQYGISIKCPKGWDMNEVNRRFLSRTTLVEFTHPNLTGQPKIKLAIVHEDPHIDISSPQNYVKTMTAQRQRYIKNFKIIEDVSEVIVNGNTLLKSGYIVLALRFEEYCFSKDDKLFDLSFSAFPSVFDNSREEFDEAIKSLIIE